MNTCVCLYLIYTSKVALCTHSCTNSAHCDLYQFYCWHHNLVVLIC